MKAEEKAHAVYNKFYLALKESMDILKIQSKERAKTAALIAVDEILEIKSVYHSEELNDYWQEVKQHLLTLNQ